MGPVGLVFRSELRGRWRSWLALVVLIALVGGFVLGATAAGRRTAGAFPRFVGAHGFDSVLFTDAPVPAAHLPNVASALYSAAPVSGSPLSCTCKLPIAPSSGLGIYTLPAAQLPRPVKLVAGRWPSAAAPDEVLASFTLEDDYGVHIGTRIRLPFFGATQAADVLNSTGSPNGPVRTLHVVGIEASEIEFPNGQSPSYDLWTTSALAKALQGQATFFDAYFLHLRHGAADVPSLAAEATRLGVLYTVNQDTSVSSIVTSIHPQAVGWWVLAVLAGIAGLGVVGQALARQSVIEAEDFPTLSTVGLAPRQLAALGMARTTVVGVCAAAGAVVVAIALSPLSPVGEARLAEPNTGIALDPLVLAVGGLGIVAVVCALGAVPALRQASARAWRDKWSSRPSGIVTGLAGAGAPPSIVMGVRQALVRGRGRTTVPVGTALVGTVIGVTALCGTAVFGASLSHLTTNPALYGEPFQFELGGLPPGQQAQAMGVVSDLQKSSAIARITLGTSQQILVDGKAVDLLAGTSMRGPVLLSWSDGPFPSGGDEIALGTSTLKMVHANVGSTVRVTAPSPTGTTGTGLFRVVSRLSAPADVGTGGLGSGAAMQLSAYFDLLCPPGPSRAGCISTVNSETSFAVLASGVPGRRGAVAIRHYLGEYSGTGAISPTLPSSLVNFGQAVNFPLILDTVLALFGAATMVHLLVVSVARRRREIGLLKAIGFLNRQIAGLVCWQATTVALVGVVFGVPLGIAAGKAAWNAFAVNLGVVPASSVAAGVLVGLALGVLLVANVLAVLPAIVASRSRPGPLLRTT